MTTHGRAESLPFVDGTFDAIVCQFGVMFFADKDLAYREAYRVLGCGGRYHFNVWDSFDFNPFASVAHDTIAGFFNGDAPAFFTVPFGYHRIDKIKSSLLSSGFTDISVHVLKIDKTIRASRQFAEGLILGNPIGEEIRVRGTADSAAIIAAVGGALRNAFGEDPRRDFVVVEHLAHHYPLGYRDAARLEFAGEGVGDVIGDET